VQTPQLADKLLAFAYFTAATNDGFELARDAQAGRDQIFEPQVQCGKLALGRL
jgi:hypothetical protein